MDPTRPDRLFAVHNCELSASSDGGMTWDLLAVHESQGGCITTVALASSRPETVYVGGYRGSAGLEAWIARSEDAGESWSDVALPQGEAFAGVPGLAVDPSRPSVVYAVFPKAGGSQAFRMFRTDNAGESWHVVFEQARYAPLIDPAQPETLYMVTGQNSLVYRSFNRGETWSSSMLPSETPDDLALTRDIALSAEALYVTTGDGRLFRSTDRGQSWSADSGPSVPVTEVETDPVQPNIIYALGYSPPEQGFLLKLNPDASRIEYLTLLGGNGADRVDDLVIDDEGRVHATGTTGSADFPVTAQLGSNHPGFQTDAFLAIVNPQGDVLEFSALVGGSSDEEAPRIALGADNGIVLAGSTLSGDFPGETPFAAQSANTRNLWVAAVQPDQNRLVFSRGLSQGATAGPIALAADQEGATYVAGTRSMAGDNGFTVETKFLMRLDAAGNVTHLDPINADALAVRSASSIVAAAAGASGIVGAADLSGQKHAVSASVIDYGGGETQGPRMLAIVNAADQLGHPASPGTVVTIYGANLGPAAGVAGVPIDGRFPAELAGVRVLFGDHPAPLLYVSAGQINAVTPGDLGEHPLVPIRVERDGASSNSFTLTTHTISPGIFLAGAYPVAINSDGTLNSADSPAPPGSAVTVFATGVGAFSPPLADGEIAPLEPPFPSAPGIAEVQIEASFVALLEPRAAPITYAGAAPGVVAGLAQINFIIPMETPAGTWELKLKTAAGELSGPALLAVGP